MKHDRSVSKHSKEDGKTITGVISITRKGVGYLKSPGFTEDIELAQSDLGTALNGDMVDVMLLKKKQGKRLSGTVSRIVERKTTKFVGTLKNDNGNLLLVPDDKRMRVTITIKNHGNGKEAKNGMKALVDMDSWDYEEQNPTGTIIEIIGKKGVHETEMRSIVLAHGFKTGFSEDVLREAKEIESKDITEEDIEERRDFRKITTFTIDPRTAKDFDDAISIQKLGGGIIEVGIHIADVSHYIKRGSAIDKEARSRTTSIYLVDRTIPMLPEAISNGVCSLNPKEDRLTYSAVFQFNNSFQVIKRWFGKTVIHSNKRFTYEDAQEVLDSKKGEFKEELQLLNATSTHLREERFKNGSIDFDQDEISFTLDENGKPISIQKKERIDTNRLIEDLMLLANREVASHFKELCKKLPQDHLTFIYRVHDAPNPEKIENLSILLKAIGYELKHEDGVVSAQELNRLFQTVEGAPEENLIKTATIRSMAKAIYSTKNIGHFGLSFAYYTHFTSPIRRYPDILVHRILKSCLGGKPIPKEELSQYETLVIQSSQRETEAVEAERESIKLKQVEYMSEHIGENFTGSITGVTQWGIYVKEENTYAEGFMRVSSLKDDYYEYDKERYRLIGNRTKKAYTLGDTVSIRLIAADIEEKTLEWAPAR